jgi:hypothetical protein
MYKPLLIPALLLTLTAHAASPQLTKILPRGGQRGTTVELTFEGATLADAQEVFVYEPGVTVTKIEQPADAKLAGKQVKVTLRIAPDARLGEYALRLRTAGGISECRTFFVGTLPVIQEVEPNNEFKKPQPIPLNHTIAGTIENEDQDFFVVEAKKGQRITAEVEGMRLGNALFDPYVAILDENRFELSASDDTPLLKQDSIASIIAPRDGKYIIQLRETSFGGSGDSYYRLHVGTFPRPRITFPLGGQAGQSLSLKFLGDVKGPIDHNLVLPAKADPHFDLLARQDGQLAPSPNVIRVSEFPNVMEVEPNETVQTATEYKGELPVAFNGVISEAPETAAAKDPGNPNADADFFKFTAKKGQALDINVYARRLGSPLDPILTVYDAAGKQIGANDDTGGPDSYFRFAVPADGQYVIRVRDHLRGASPMHAYRVEITPVKPSVAVGIPVYTQQYSQERQAVAIHKGNRYATLMRIQRADVGGPLLLECPDLPAGVKMIAEPAEPGVDAVPVIFEAADDAKIAGRLVDVRAKPADPKAGAFASGFKQVVELVHGPPNNTKYHETSVDRMAIAVAEEAPFKLTLVEPKVPLVQGGQMSLKVIADRKKDFTGPIRLQFLFRPPGIEAGATVEIPANQNEALYPINASDGAAAKKWKVVVLGSADSNGTNWVSSQFVTLEVVPPFVTGKIALAKVEQGKNVAITADLDQKTKFDGKAKIELLGLPGNSATEPKEITADDKKIEFPVTTKENTPAAQHNGLFLRVTIMKDGEPIIHNIARGGILRVDSPLKAKDKDAKSADKKAPDKKPAEKKTAK